MITILGKEFRAEGSDASGWKVFQLEDEAYLYFATLRTKMGGKLRKAATKEETDGIIADAIGEHDSEFERLAPVFN